MPILELEFANGEGSLSVRRFSIRESVHGLFSVLVWAKSPDPSLKLDAIVGRPASFRVESGLAFSHGGARRWDGVCDHAEQEQAESTGLSSYFFRIGPALSQLERRRDYRLFQHLSVPQIAAKVLSEHGIAPIFRIDHSLYPQLTLRTQYGESDYVFLRRLLEEAGIAYFFADPAGSGSQLVLGDALHAEEPRLPVIPYVDNPQQAAEKEHVRRVTLRHETRPGARALRDYDFRRPALSLLSEAPRAKSPEDRLEEHVYLPGSMLVERGKSDESPRADDKGVARHDQAHGKARAEMGLSAARTGKIEVTFETNVLDLWPGRVFTVVFHAHPEIDNKPLLCVALQLDGTHDGEWTIAGRAVPADVPYRPPLLTPRPLIRNVQCAIVTGTPGEEIHTDEHGRVRVQFPWDREGKLDDNSSCWMHVSQGWAGAGYGMFHLPRVGQEVLVLFLDGNPDAPVVVGRLFNRAEPVPYTLPGERTKSTWKSSVAPGGVGYNELLWEDKKGEELARLTAERNQRLLVKHDETITVNHDREKRVEGAEIETTVGQRTEVTGRDRRQTLALGRTQVVSGEMGHLVKGMRTERVLASCQRFTGGDDNTKVQLEKREQLDQDSHLIVKGSRHVEVGSTMSVSAPSVQISAGKNAGFSSGDETHLASDVAVGEAPDITVKGPGGFIRIDGGGVTIVGTLVLINAGGGPGSGSGVSAASPLLPREAPEGQPVPVIVSETVAAQPGSRSRTKIGVGEEVVLTYTGGDATWTVSGGGTILPASGRTVTFRAGERSANPVVTATGAPGVASLAFEVVEPTDFVMEQTPATKVKHTAGRPDCGFLANLYLLPADVSFQNIEVRELNSRADATGFYQAFDGLTHQPAAQPHSKWFTVGAPAPGRGSVAHLHDTIYSGDTLVGPPFPAGSMVFPITWEFRVAGGAPKAIPSTFQNHQVEAVTGKCTSSKAGENKSRVPADPPSDFL